MSFGVGRFAAADGTAFAGVVAGERVVDLRPRFGNTVTVRALLENWDRSLETLREVAAEPDRDTLALGDLTVLPPIEPPVSHLLAAANYRRHVLEMKTNSDIAAGLSAEEAEAAASQWLDDLMRGSPFVFTGWHGAVIGPYDDVELPNNGKLHDWELELAVVIGRPARYVESAEAMDYVAGYTIANDLSTRDRMFRTDVPFTDFMATKLWTTSKPVGPWITPAEFVADPHDLRMTLSVNGQTMQDDSTSDMIFRIERLIEYVSGITTLGPGDIILTGSPSGNAAQHGGRFLRPGDVIEAEIEGLGAQRNRCVAAPGEPRGPDYSALYVVPGAAR